MIYERVHERDEDPAVANEIRRQQVMLLVSLVPTMSIVNAINGLVLVLLFWNVANHVAALGWYAVLMTAVGFQLWGWSRVRGKPAPKRISRKGLDRSKWHSLGAGLVWGAICFVFFPSGLIPYQMVLLVVIAGMAAGTTANLNPIPSMTTRFLIGIMGPMLVRLTIEGTPMHYAIGFMSGVLAVALVMGSRRAYHQLASMARSSIMMDKARSDLEDAIESTNDAFALFDENKRLMTANTRFRKWFSGAKSIRGGDSKGRLRQLDGGRWVVSTLRPTSRGGYVSVHVDVSDLKQREEELLAAKLKAESADRAKTQFLANMSHELRTPLNAIIGFSQIMRDQVFGVVGDARYRAYIDDIFHSGQHLLSIINDILDLSKIETSRHQLEFENVEVEEIVQWAVTVCRGRDAEDAARPVEIDIDEHVQWLEADRRALKQILINLLANAMKFSEPDTAVGVRLKHESDGSATLQVWDRGIGIAPDKIAEVTKPFFQAENAFVKRYQGAGLGLAIVDSLVRGHEGELTIDSEEGVGTVVNVRFPAARVPAVVDAVPRLAAG